MLVHNPWLKEYMQGIQLQHLHELLSSFSRALCNSAGMTKLVQSMILGPLKWELRFGFFIWTLEIVGLQLRVLQNIEKGQNLVKKPLTGKKINLLLPKPILSPFQSSLPLSQPTLPKWHTFLGKCLSRGLVDSWNFCWCQHTLSFI